MMSTALQEALTRLKAQERAMAARAEASERLSGQIIAGVAAGLIVVDRKGVVQIVNPAARRILSLGPGGEGQPIAVVIAHVAPLAEAISETVHSGVPVARRQLRLEGSRHTSASASRRWSAPTAAAGCGVPVLRPHGGRRARRAAPAEGGARRRRRDDRRARSRVSERPRHDPRVCPALRSRRACRRRIASTSRAFGRRPTRSERS